MAARGPPTVLLRDGPSVAASGGLRPYIQISRLYVSPVTDGCQKTVRWLSDGSPIPDLGKAVRWVSQSVPRITNAWDQPPVGRPILKYQINKIKFIDKNDKGEPLDPNSLGVS